MTTPNPRLTHVIQVPALGSRASAPDDTPTSTSNAHIPSAKLKRYRKPTAPLCVVVTQVSTAAIAGAPHGAATSPDTAPITNTPPKLPTLPARAARSISHGGIGTGSTSNIVSAKMISRFAIAKYSHGLVLIV